MATRTSDMVQRSTSVVVVPYGSPLRCLRMDMVIELVSEVWAMVSHGLLHHHPHEDECLEGQIFLNSEKVAILPHGEAHNPLLHS